MKNLNLKGKIKDKGKKNNKDNFFNKKVLKLAIYIQKIAFIG